MNGFAGGLVKDNSEIAYSRKITGENFASAKITKMLN